MLQLLEKLDRWARERPSAIALRELPVDEESGFITWSRLRTVVDTFSRRLRRDAKPGSVGLLCCPNICEFWIAFLAMLDAGMTVFPVAPDLTEAELIDAVERTNARYFIGEPKLGRYAYEHSLIYVMTEEIGTLKQYPSVDRPVVSPDAHGLLLLSSGTSGQPKIVFRTAVSIDCVSSNMVNSIGVRSDDCILATVPLCHSYGIEHGLLVGLWAGCETRLMQGLDMHVMLNQLRGGEVTILPSVPAAYEMLSRLAEAGTRFPSLRLAYSAGAPLPLGVYEAMMDSLGVRVAQLYGATEIGSVTFSHPAQEPFDPASVGRAMEGVALRIADPDLPQSQAAAGVEGPLFVAADSMMAGYWGEGPVELKDGYYETGDLARVDVHGNLTITGRSKLLIDVGGKKVNPLEVEAILLQHGEVGDACVVAMHLSPTVRRLRAVISPRAVGGAVDVAALRGYCRERLAPHKVPRIFEVRPSLPRSANGKVQRRLLEESGA